MFLRDLPGVPLALTSNAGPTSVRQSVYFLELPHSLRVIPRARVIGLALWNSLLSFSNPRHHFSEVSLVEKSTQSWHPPRPIPMLP